MKFCVNVAFTILALALLSTTSVRAQQRPKITGVSHLAIYTTDAAKTEFFFVHDLGAVKSPDPEDPAGTRYHFNSVQFVEVLALPSGAAPKNRFDHAAFSTPDAEALRRYLKAHGVATPVAVTIASDGSQYFEVKDPEENRVQFVQPPKPLPAVKKNPEAVSDHMIHVGYIVHDPALEDKFYVDLLGFRPYWHGGMKDNETQWISQQVPNGTDWLEYMVISGPEKTGIPSDMSQETAGVLDHFALGVQNMERSVESSLPRRPSYDAPLTAPNRARWKMADQSLRAGWNSGGTDGIPPAVKPCCSPFLLPSPTQ